MTDHNNTVIREGNSKLFVKDFFSGPALLKELGGYEIISKHYPVPRLLNKDSCQRESRLVFEFEESIGPNRGLLLDIFNKTESAAAFEKIFQMYASVFGKTLEKASAPAADVFFKDRASKLKEKYPALYAATDEYKMHFKGVHISIQLSEIIDSVMSYFSKEGQGELWSIISQADPGDLNIGIKPVLLDYLAGGRVPLMAEFANIIWEQIAQSAVLAPVYNAKMYTEHDLVYQNVPVIALQDGRMEFKPAKERLLFLDEYTQRVIMPLMDRIEYSDWYHDLKNHIAMRIIGVFDISTFSSEHRSLALGYLGLFYNTWKPRTPLELIELIKK